MQWRRWAILLVVALAVAGCGETPEQIDARIDVEVKAALGAGRYPEALALRSKQRADARSSFGEGSPLEKLRMVQEADAHLAWGLALRRAGKHDEAFEHLKVAYNVRSQNPEILPGGIRAAIKPMLEVMLERKEFRVAEDIGQTLVRVELLQGSEDDPPGYAYGRLGAAFEGKENWAAAAARYRQQLAELEKAHGEAPMIVPALQGLLRCAEARGDEEQMKQLEARMNPLLVR